MLRSIIAVSGKINGGAAAPPIDPARVATLLDKVNVLTSLIRRTSQTDAATGAVGLDPLSSATRSLVSETTVATELLRGVIRSLVPDQATRSESRGFEGWVAALASPAIGTGGPRGPQGGEILAEFLEGHLGPLRERPGPPASRVRRCDQREEP